MTDLAVSFWQRGKLLGCETGVWCAQFSMARAAARLLEGLWGSYNTASNDLGSCLCSSRNVAVLVSPFLLPCSSPRTRLALPHSLL